MNEIVELVEELNEAVSALTVATLVEDKDRMKETVEKTTSLALKILALLD